jgi:hypothetical protein
MKQFVLFLFAVLLLSGLQAQTCTPDPGYTTPGIYPVNGSSNGFANVQMADAFEGMFYDEVVQLKIPSDTIIDTLGLQITASIDSLVILDFINLPASMSYQCNDIACEYVGDENGCVRFTGTPTSGDAGTYNVGLLGFGYVSAGILGSLADTLLFPMQLEILPAQGIDEFVSRGSIVFSPNPFHDVAVLQFRAVKNTPYQVRIIDLTGRTVQTHAGNTLAGNNSVSVHRNDLPGGMYFYSLEIEEHRHTGRFIINR